MNLSLYHYGALNPLVFIDPDGNADKVAVIYGGAQTLDPITAFSERKNPFGHVAIAFSGEGVVSFGTGDKGTPGLSEYLGRQSEYRDSIVHVIDVTPQQKKEMLEYAKSLTGKYLPAVPSADSNDTCATRTNEILKKGGMEDPSRSPVVEAMESLGLAKDTVSNMPTDTARTASAYASHSYKVPKGTDVKALPQEFKEFQKQE